MQDAAKNGVPGVSRWRLRIGLALLIPLLLAAVEKRVDLAVGAAGAIGSGCRARETS